MILSNGICHYKEISVVPCFGCDMELVGKRYCDVCANREYKKMVNAKLPKERILEFIDKTYFIHTFKDYRYRALKKMV